VADPFGGGLVEATTGYTREMQQSRDQNAKRGRGQAMKDDLKERHSKLTSDTARRTSHVGVILHPLPTYCWVVYLADKWIGKKCYAARV
jgi:hypothetical protein